jgi:hypothetical protein
MSDERKCPEDATPMVYRKFVKFASGERFEVWQCPHCHEKWYKEVNYE